MLNLKSPTKKIIIIQTQNDQKSKQCNSAAKVKSDAGTMGYLFICFFLDQGTLYRMSYRKTSKRAHSIGN